MVKSATGNQPEDDKKSAESNQKPVGNPSSPDHSVDAPQPDNPASKPNPSNRPTQSPVSTATHTTEVPPGVVPPRKGDDRPNADDEPTVNPNVPGRGRNIPPEQLYPVPNEDQKVSGKPVYLGDEPSGNKVFAAPGAQNDPNSPHSISAAVSVDNTVPHSLEKPTPDEFLAPYKEYQDIAHAINLALYTQVTKLGYDYWWARTCLQESLKYLSRDWVNERDQGKFDEPTATAQDEKTVSARSGNNPDTDNDTVESVDSQA